MAKNWIPALFALTLSFFACGADSAPGGAHGVSGAPKSGRPKTEEPKGLPKDFKIHLDRSIRFTDGTRRFYRVMSADGTPLGSARLVAGTHTLSLGAGCLARVQSRQGFSVENCDRSARGSLTEYRRSSPNGTENRNYVLYDARGAIHLRLEGDDARGTYRILNAQGTVVAEARFELPLGTFWLLHVTRHEAVDDGDLLVLLHRKLEERFANVR